MANWIKINKTMGIGGYDEIIMTAEAFDDFREAAYKVDNRNNSRIITVQQNEERPTSPFYIRSYGTSTLKFTMRNSNVNLEYSTGDSWHTATNGTSVTFSGDLFVRGDNDELGDVSFSTIFTITGSNVDIGGDIMYLLDPNRKYKPLPRYCFASLFSGNNTIINANDLILPSDIADYCYWSMFNNCRNLETAPVLPSPQLAYACYQTMFTNCRSLREITCLSAIPLNNSAANNWVRYASTEGTFYKLRGVNHPIGEYYGVPDGWKVVDI